MAITLSEAQRQITRCGLAAPRAELISLQVRFSNKVAVITGGGSGMGAAAAKAFAREGAKVVICGRTLSKLEEVRRAEDDLTERILPVEADIAKEEDVKRLYSETIKRYGQLDVVFAHAGINGVWAPIEELTCEEWEKTLRINLTGTFLTVKHATTLLKKTRGAIVVTSSINGSTKFSDVGSSAYSASKAAQLAFVKMIALELAPAGVRVNAVCPGSIETDVDEHTEERGLTPHHDVADYRRGGIPLTNGVSGSAEEVAKLVLFLASQDASHITGASVVVDGAQSLVQ